MESYGVMSARQEAPPAGRLALYDSVISVSYRGLQGPPWASMGQLQDGEGEERVRRSLTSVAGVRPGAQGGGGGGGGGRGGGGGGGNRQRDMEMFGRETSHRRNVRGKYTDL
uniref:Uncharacterized protein n=1 Tax=Knipowitschia caucasica TaxID=637954 RepID=A0AAV2L5N6_KNICA